MDAILKTEDLTKRYGKARGIEALSISVAEGEFFGFIGPNGAGKSTTIRTLLGLISPTAGRAELFGLDCVKRRKQILAQVGYLPSEAAFYPGMRAGEVIAFSAKLRGVDCAQEAATLCERLALDPRRKVEELSLGNRKKLGIICGDSADGMPSTAAPRCFFPLTCFLRSSAIAAVPLSSGRGGSLPVIRWSASHAQLRGA